MSMGAFDDDFAAADTAFAEAFGHTVSLTRGASLTTGVTAEVVEHDYERFEAYSSQTVAQSRSFVIDVADYAFSGAVATPQPGDEIRESIAGTTHVFVVMPVGSAPCYEWVGATKPQWKVHTKFTGTE
jgi:hypothetical protein